MSISVLLQYLIFKMQALSEAMDQQSNGGAVGDYLEDRMVQSTTDDELLKVMDGCNRVRSINIPLLQQNELLRVSDRDYTRSLSFCSDVSSFEVVDAKEASDVNGAQICGSCSLAYSLQGSAKACR